MNRKEFTEALDRIEAFLNKVPNTPVKERPALLMTVEYDFRAIRKACALDSILQGPAERLYPLIREYVRLPSEEQRKAVDRVFGSLRYNKSLIPE